MDKLIEVKDLSKYFETKDFLGRSKHVTKAVDGVTLTIHQGETFGLVGESGCGKSTLGRTMIRMYEPTEGEIRYNGTDITKLKGKELTEFHKKMQVIFQDPYSSLDPNLMVRDIIAEPIRVFEDATEEQIDARVAELLEAVGLSKEDMYKYPHEFSGGQRQRVGIARALSVNPEFVLCDEPLSALDVSIQAQVVRLLEELQEKYGLTYLFVAHDLNMVHHISDQIGVMYLGQMVEVGESDAVYFEPKHPYTKALLRAIPHIEKDQILNLEENVIEGDIPSPFHVPSGCHFHPRCPYATERCRSEQPRLQDVGDGRLVACFAATETA